MSLNLDSLFDTVINVHWGTGPVFVLFEQAGPVPLGQVTGPKPIPPATNAILTLPTGRSLRIHASTDGKKWRTINTPGDAWASIPTFANDNGAWIYSYNVSNGWLYHFTFGDTGNYDFVGLYSGTSTVVMSTDGFTWTKKVGGAGSFPPFMNGDGSVPRTNDAPIKSLAVPANPSHKNSFQWQQLVIPNNGHPGTAIYKTAYAANPIKAGEVPFDPLLPYPGKITDVTTQDPILNDGLHPGFWYSEDHTKTWHHTLSFPPTTGAFETDVELSFARPGA